MEFGSTVEFAAAARVLSRAVGRRRLVAPNFRCPPRLVGADRTIRRRPPTEGGGTVVSVRVKDRPREAVLADMIEGVVAANGLTTPASDRLRSELWALVARTVLADRTNTAHADPGAPGADGVAPVAGAA